MPHWMATFLRDFSLVVAGGLIGGMIGTIQSEIGRNLAYIMAVLCVLFSVFIGKMMHNDDQANGKGIADRASG